MNAAIILIGLIVFGSVVFLAPSAGPAALTMAVVVSLPTILLLSRTSPERTFLLRLFVTGFLVRVILATVIYLGHLEEFFGGDATTYNFFGMALNASWHGDAYQGTLYQAFVASGAGAWGMLYFVASVYEVIGQNIFAI